MSDPDRSFAGWYPDAQTGGLRYWDGSRWTGDVRPATPSVVVNVTTTTTTSPPGWHDDGSGRARWWDGQQWTNHYRVTGTPGSGSSSHRWWALSPVYTFGILAFIPALHAAIKLRRRDLWYWAGGLIAGNIVVWSLLGSSPSDPEAANTFGENVGAALCLILAVLGTIQAFRTRDAVFGESGAPTAPAVASAGIELDPAVATSLAARKRRAQSVELTLRDPGLARDLMIGRPDLVRQYDDGGLVDVNHAPEAVLVSHLGFSHEQARTVIEVRDRLGGFAGTNELCSLADLPPKAVDDIRDRVVCL